MHNAPVTQPKSNAEARARRWAWVPPAALLLSILLLWNTAPKFAHESSLLLFAVNVPFTLFTGLMIAFLVGRSFLTTGAASLLLLGCGVTFWAGAAVVAVGASSWDTNGQITIHNLCAWLAAACHLAGALVSMKSERRLAGHGAWLLGAYLGAVAAVIMVVVAVRENWLPLFFVQGQGGTPLRQMVVGSSVMMFGATAWLLAAGKKRPLSSFIYWYSLALALAAVGLFGVLLQSAAGSLLNWTSRGAMVLGGVYMLVAAVASARESGGWRVSLETALRESEERLRVALEKTNTAMWDWNLKTNKVYWSPEHYRQLGYAPDSIEPGYASWVARVHPADLAETEAAIQASMRERREYQKDYRVLLPDGTVRWLGARAHYICGPTGECERMVGVMNDVTERKEAEAALARSKAELETLVNERTAKLQETVEELEHFSYTITHDMRAPLRAMTGFIKILEEEIGETFAAEHKGYFDRILAGAQRMDQLITDALQYSKAGKIEMPLRPVDTGALLRGLLNTYPNLQPPEARIRLAENLPCVIGNEAGLTQCFSNLLGNAVKFAKPGAPAEITVSAETRDGFVRLNFADRGIGIPPSALAKVFGMWQRASTSHEGTGLGLALAKRVTERMGGRIGVESALGQGSTFWVELKPAAPAGMVN